MNWRFVILLIINALLWFAVVWAAGTVITAYRPTTTPAQTIWTDGKDLATWPIYWGKGKITYMQMRVKPDGHVETNQYYNKCSW